MRGTGFTSGIKASLRYIENRDLQGLLAMQTLDYTLAEAKQRLRLPELARKLGIRGEIPDRDGKNVQCFWPDRHNHGDRNHSFGFHADLTRYRCFGCDAKGDGPDMVAEWLGIPDRDAQREFMRLAGELPSRIGGTHPAAKAKAVRRPAFPPDMHAPTQTEVAEIARSRWLSPAAVDLAARMHCVRVGTVAGFPSWILMDKSGVVAEARRIDREAFPALGKLPERKTHTLRGSDKSWPVGIHPHLPTTAGAFSKVMVVEGTPDYLAALHWCIELARFDVLPVAILGRQSHNLHPDALALMAGREVRIYPHKDKDNGGVEAGERWQEQIRAAGANSFRLWRIPAPLTTLDSAPVTDLNDLALCHPDVIAQLAQPEADFLP